MLSYDLVIIGFGVIGSEALDYINKIKFKKNTKIKIAIIDKDKKNIPGGVGYSINKSKYGFFNNPLRLSHPRFIRWISKPVNFKRCCKFLSDNPSYNLNNWLNKNVKISNKNFLEIYLPRLFYSFYLNEKILNVIKENNMSLKVNFFKGDVSNLLKKDNKIILSGNSFAKYVLKEKNNKIVFDDKKYKIKSITAKKIILGLGLLPPKKIKTNFVKSYNYIWDFYSEGATQNLINKINKLKIKRKINVIFIGNKAGFLETMQKLEKLIIHNNLNIKIYCIASKNETLQKAILSEKYHKYSFKYLVNSEINKIKQPSKILSLIKKEFIFSEKIGFNKYDIWTLILKKKILSKFYLKLSSKAKEEYNSKIFNKIRNITRYTYPETVNAKERLEKKGKIKFINDKVILVKKLRNNFLIITEKKKTFIGDIVNNVSGPVNILENYKESSLINSLKRISKKYDKSGFFTDKNFKLDENIFSPGVISNNFNPTRETIIKAITNNVYKVSKKIIKEI
jgi:hypothetical protein